MRTAKRKGKVDCNTSMSAQSSCVDDVRFSPLRFWWGNRLLSLRPGPPEQVEQGEWTARPTRSVESQFPGDYPVSGLQPGRGEGHGRHMPQRAPKVVYIARAHSEEMAPNLMGVSPKCPAGFWRAKLGFGRAPVSSELFFRTGHKRRRLRAAAPSAESGTPGGARLIVRLPPTPALAKQLASMCLLRAFARTPAVGHRRAARLRPSPTSGIRHAGDFRSLSELCEAESGQLLGRFLVYLTEFRSRLFKAAI